ncbi:hypothetical protein EXE06_03980 [Acinetobacter pittii]|uniref:Uncharacterized protein n=2 Tax=Acinetobacter pittii TaxID=48296 RepID=A0AB33B868_ACIPI|nr:hypothetical protein IEC338SC_1035 [Acinetobacter pittii]RZG84840.1 hypothetical protein EXE06_03980 [Acinetobacter pittii]RZH55985.1 hypothetical protein EXD88_08560 [Acinetobacter pittii]RZH61348.1 hypothetical protein EXD90_04315 [Acinetobacter pittii]
MNVDEIRVKINQLYLWDGYQREAALRQLSGCFEPSLFPHLLRKLSDYVQVNRHLAARHLLEWAERSDCADLCITYFLDIEAIKGRIRIVGEIEDILMDKIHQNLDKVKLVLLSKQGKLSRALFNYAQSKQLIIESELLDIAKNANDQWLRRYWINFALQQNEDFLKSEFRLSKYVDVKKVLLNRLLELDALDNEILMIALNSANLSIIDFAIFVLKSRDFDFNEYFIQFQNNQLENGSVKKCLLQMLILEWNKQDFYLYIDNLNDKSILFMILYRALKMKYISLGEVINLFYRKQLKLPFYLLQKIAKLSTELKEIDELYLLTTTPISFVQRLEFSENLSFWDKVEWLIHIEKYCQTEDEKDVLRDSIKIVLNLAKYQYYSPLWKKDDKEIYWILFQNMGNVLNLVHIYPQEYENLKKLITK